MRISRNRTDRTSTQPIPPASRAPGFALRSAGVMLGLAALAACAGTTPTDDADARPGPRTVQPGAPGTAGQDRSASTETMAERHAHTEADVLFVRNMIHHHAQAVEMSRMVPDRTSRTDILLLARRIDRSQEDEIAFMTNWLRLRGEEVPPMAMGMATHADHTDHTDHTDRGQALMAGMLTRERMDELAAARGEAFDRLFIESMIYHHEGALDMVEELFSTRGAAQDTELFQFASHVDADQRIEIGRMYRMLNSLVDG